MANYLADSGRSSYGEEKESVIFGFVITNGRTGAGDGARTCG